MIKKAALKVYTIKYMGKQEISFKQLCHHYCKWNFWNAFSVILVIVAACIGMIILYFYDNSSSLVASYHLIKGLPVIISLVIIPINILYLGYHISCLRQTTPSQSLGYGKLLASSFVVSFGWNLVMYAYLLIIGCLLIRGNVFLLKSILWGQLVYGLVVLHLTCYCIMLMLNLWIKNENLVLWITGTLVILSLILSGQLVPYFLYPRTDILAYFNLLMPLNYAIGLINNTCMMPNIIEKATNSVATFGVANIYELLNSPLTPEFYEKVIYSKYGINIFTIDLAFKMSENGKNFIVFNHWTKVLNLIIPWLISSVAFGISYYCADRTFICRKD